MVSYHLQNSHLLNKRCQLPVNNSRACKQLSIADTAEGSLTIFWELFTVIPYPLKDFKRL